MSYKEWAAHDAGRAALPMTSIKLTLTHAVKQQLIGIAVGSCDCQTKSPAVHAHLATCRFRQAMEALDNVDELITLIRADGSP